MKNKIIFTSLVLLIFTGTSFSQFTFSVSQGIGLSNAQLGYKVNERVVPYIGFMYMRLGTNYESMRKSWDYDKDKVVEESFDDKISVNVMVPTLGLKYFFYPEKEIKAYTSFNVSKPLIRGKASYDDLEEDINEELKKLKLWGFELGFGAEYFFNVNFSIGGEFGLRYWTGKLENNYESSYYNPNTGNYVSYDRENKNSLSLIPTYTKASMNFYF